MVWTCPEEDRDCVGRRVLRMELAGGRPRGRPERRFMDEVKDEVSRWDRRECRGLEETRGGGMIHGGHS